LPAESVGGPACRKAGHDLFDPVRRIERQIKPLLEAEPAPPGAGAIALN